jgi:hypothetical protein
MIPCGLPKNRQAISVFTLTNLQYLGEQIRLINKWSNNVMTRQTLLTLDAKLYDAAAILPKG